MQPPARDPLISIEIGGSPGFLAMSSTEKFSADLGLDLGLAATNFGGCLEQEILLVRSTDFN